jgi:hypothetical protein
MVTEERALYIASAGADGADASDMPAARTGTPGKLHRAMSAGPLLRKLAGEAAAPPAPAPPPVVVAAAAAARRPTAPLGGEGSSHAPLSALAGMPQLGLLSRADSAPSRDVLLGARPRSDSMPMPKQPAYPAALGAARAPSAAGAAAASGMGSAAGVMGGGGAGGEAGLWRRGPVRPMSAVQALPAPPPVVSGAPWHIRIKTGLWLILLRRDRVSGGCQAQCRAVRVGTVWVRAARARTGFCGQRRRQRRGRRHAVCGRHVGACAHGRALRHPRQGTVPSSLRAVVAPC